MMKVVIIYLNRPKQDKKIWYSTFPTRKRIKGIKEWQEKNNKGKASKRRKQIKEVCESFCVLADTEGNDDEEEDLGEAAFQNLKDAHLMVKASQLSLFVTTLIIMGWHFFCTRTLMRFSSTY
jgi:hypothetical protein